MSISIQTNVTSLMAQENLSINQRFESQTIDRLTSGYRINSSGDDAAGLAVANQYRADISELTQGVQNANNGVSQLQIVDGGLSNISQMLDRMKTLAAESASGTFTGDRGTLNTEYQQLITEITRQASNVNLNAGGSFNANLNVYIGGGRTSNLAGSTQINVDLSGSASAVDAVSLGLNTTSVIGGGTDFASNTVANLNNPDAVFNIGASGAETFAITSTSASGAVQTQTVSITGDGGRGQRHSFRQCSQQRDRRERDRHTWSYRADRKRRVSPVLRRKPASGGRRHERDGPNEPGHGRLVIDQ